MRACHTSKKNLTAFCINVQSVMSNLSGLHLDRIEKIRRHREIDDFDDLVAQNDPVKGRSNILIQWKKRRMDNWHKAFGRMPAAPAHQVIADESVLAKEKGIRIETGRPIATGIFSIIYAARMQTSGKSTKTIDAAVKVLRKSEFARQFQIQNSDRQIRILMRLNHPHLIRVYEVFEIRNSDKILIFMQRAKMGSLEAVVRKEGTVRETPLAKKWTRDLIYAVDYLHNLGIAHRRICPGHVLLMSPNHAAKLSMPDALAEVQSVKNTGTLKSEYGSPETIFGTMFDAFPADIWSIGCTAYFMMTTHAPFKDHTRLERIKQQLNDKTWRQDSELSSDAADFLANMLHGTVDKRMTTVELLTTPWILSLTAPKSHSKNTDSVPQSPQSDPDAKNLGGALSETVKSAGTESLEDALMASLK